MEWLEKFFSGAGVPNLAGETNAALAANPEVQAARGPGGSFDTSRLGAQIGPEGQDGLAYLKSIYDMQQAATAEARRPPERTGLQFLGHALSAASVPVAYAQGNESFARAMTGRTGADVYNARVNAYEDAAREAQATLAGNQASAYGEYGLGVLKDKRERARNIRIKAADIVRSGQGRPDAVKAAADWARAQGDTELADQLMTAPGAPGATPPSPSAPSGVPPAASGAVSMPVAAPGPAPGPAVPVMPAAPQVGLAPGEDHAKAQAVELHRQADMAETLGDTGRAKALRNEATSLLAPGEEYRKKFAQDTAVADAERGQKTQMAGTMAKQAESYIASLRDILKTPGIDQYIGPIEGGVIGKYITDPLNDLRPGNQASPAMRDAITSTQANLVQLVKPFLRVAGEGSQDAREFQSIVDSVGDITSSRNADEANAKVDNMEQRLRVMLSKYSGDAPEIASMRTSAARGPAQAAVPPAAQAAVPPAAQDAVGSRRLKDGVPHIKTAEGWVPVANAPQAPIRTGGVGDPNYDRMR